jgi:diguanylate cyclase
MNVLIDLVSTNEEALMYSVIGYAKKHGYARYTSSLAEAWRQSIAGISLALRDAAALHPAPIETNAERDAAKADPVTSFLVREARKHRSRGIPFGMFLGGMKLCRKAYLDLISDEMPGTENKRYREYLNAFFDHLEIGFCSEWSSLDESERLAELQVRNRLLTNEKNRYLAIFETLQAPVLVLDENQRIENMNPAAAAVFGGIPRTGYPTARTAADLPWIEEEISSLATSGNIARNLVKNLPTQQGEKTYDVRLKRIDDIGGNFNGTLVVMHDVTDFAGTAA